MTTAALQCKNCGANLVPDPQNPNNYYCPSCRSRYAPEQNDTYVTNEYKYDNNINVGAGGTINQTIFEQSTLRQDLASANAKLLLGDFESAMFAFAKLADDHADCGEAWWGLARAVTNDFSLNPDNKSQYLAISKYMENAVKTSGEKREYQQRYNSYRTYWESHEKQLTKQREEKLSEISRRLEADKRPIQSKIDDIENQVIDKQNKIKKYEKRGRVIPLACFIIFAVVISLTNLTSIVSNVFASAILIYLPLKIVFYFVSKAVKLTSEAQIFNLKRQLNVHQDELQRAIIASGKEMDAVMKETAWIDG